MPTIYSWYVGLQHELPAHFALDLSYSGNHAVHLMDQRQVNALPAGYLQTNSTALSSVGGFVNSLLPYRGWGNLDAVETERLFTLRRTHAARKPAVHKQLLFQLQLHAVEGDGYCGQRFRPSHQPVQYRRELRSGELQPDERVTFDLVYTLPKVRGAFDRPVARQALNGWEVSSIFRSQSGMPFTITSNGNLFGANLGSQYVNVTGDPYSGNKGNWLERCRVFKAGRWGVGRFRARRVHFAAHHQR